MSERRVIVTGGAGALGKAVRDHFVAAGDRVAVIDVSDEILNSVFPEKEDKHLYLACDLTDRDSCVSAAEAVVQAWGGIDVLCNIAGGFMMGEKVHETTDQTWNFLFELNTRSVVHMVSAAVPAMLGSAGQAGCGKIINVAAKAGLDGGALMGPYSASKAAVHRLTESMAQELRDEGINVNCVMPSIMDTPRNRSDMPSADHSKWPKTDEIAKVVGFLASDDAGVVHGAAVPVTGLS